MLPVPAPVRTLGSSGAVNRLVVLPMFTTQTLHPVVKEEYAEKARELLAGTGISITTEGKRHCYCLQIIHQSSRKVTNWIDEIKQLANIAETQPHTAHCAFTRGLSSH